MPGSRSDIVFSLPWCCEGETKDHGVASMVARIRPEFQLHANEKLPTSCYPSLRHSLKRKQSQAQTHDRTFGYIRQLKSGLLAQSKKDIFKTQLCACSRVHVGACLDRNISPAWCSLTGQISNRD